MKKFLALIVVLMLLALPALAEYAEKPLAVEGVSFMINSDYGLLIGSSDYKEALYSYDGTKLSADYEDLNGFGGHMPLLQAMNDAEDAPAGRVYGAIDDEGNEFIPVKYHDLEYISPRWQLGIIMVESTEDDADYHVFGSKDAYYQIGTADIYFDKQLVATVDREVYAGYAQAFGAFLRADGASGQASFINGAGEIIPTDSYGEYDSSYDYDTETYTYIHIPTGQQAFVPECTLTIADVDQPFLLEGTRLLDLQGNVVCEYPREYGSTPTFEYGLAAVSCSDDYSKYGVVNLSGEELVPLAYEGMYSSLEYLANFDYCFLKKDDLLGAVDINGNETVPFQYDPSSAYTYGPFLRVDNEDGTYTIVSAKVGELPEHYKYVSFYGGFAVVEGVDGGTGLISLDGEAIIPVSEDIQNITCAPYGDHILVEYKDDTFKLLEQQ